MDQTDVLILRVMGAVPLADGGRPADVLKARHVAQRLGLTPELVRTRVREMERAGIITGYQVYPNPRHLGLRQVTYHYAVDPARHADVVPRLRHLDGLQAIYEYLDHRYCIDLVYHTPTDLARKQEALRAATGATQHHAIYEAPAPPVARSLTLLDWRIIRALRGNAKRSLSGVADALGVTVKTVRRRFARMMEEGSIDVLPIVDVSRVAGIIPFELACHLAPDAERTRTVQQILHAFDDAYIYRSVPPANELGDVLLSCRARTPREIEDLRRQAEAIPGVRRATVVVPTATHHVHNWADEAIATRIAAAGTQTTAADPQTGHNERQNVPLAAAAPRHLE